MIIFNHTSVDSVLNFSRVYLIENDHNFDFRTTVFLNIKSLGKAEVFFISVASPVFSENPPKFHQKSQIYRTPLTGGLAKRSAKIKITPIPNSSLIPCFDMIMTAPLSVDHFQSSLLGGCNSKPTQK